jgi:hypothetical protein
MMWLFLCRNLSVIIRVYLFYSAWGQAVPTPAARPVDAAGRCGAHGFSRPDLTVILSIATDNIADRRRRRYVTLTQKCILDVTVTSKMTDGGDWDNDLHKASSAEERCIPRAIAR